MTRLTHACRLMTCLVVGHDDRSRCERGRMFLRCRHCGRETPGWPLYGPELVTESRALPGRTEMEPSAGPLTLPRPVRVLQFRAIWPVTDSEVAPDRSVAVGRK